MLRAVDALGLHCGQSGVPADLSVLRPGEPQ